MSLSAYDQWNTGAPYERYVGRWSRPVARAFLAWLGAPAHRTWVDVGCGTGALTGTVLAECDPVRILAVDKSPGFVAHARQALTDPRIHFDVGDAGELAIPDDEADYAVSGLVLNFVPDTAAMVREMARVTRPGGQVAAYVWDYAGGMQMMRLFWDAAAAVDPEAREADEALRFAVCRPEALAALWQRCGLLQVQTHAMEVPTVFTDFDDLWQPFLGGQGAAPGYLKTRSDDMRERIRTELLGRVPHGPDGRIPLSARAWAVQGHVTR